jgi:NAD(P)-dependent dehydrogenase (short-subunit alcohol dehydrogenase family)
MEKGWSVTMKEFSPKFELKDRVVLLTGAAGHLGPAMARGLALAGAHVMLNGRNCSALEALAHQIQKDGGHADVLPFDIADAAAVPNALAELRKRVGRLDVLINNAYHGRCGSLAQSRDDDFEESYKVAVVAAARLVREAQDLLTEAGVRNPGGASVVNVASMYGVVSPDFRVYGEPKDFNPPFYGAAKAALIQLSRYLACQLAPQRIRVNSISPGPFPSDSVQGTNPEFCNRLANRVPLGRIGQPEDLVGPAVFLASDAAAFVTGHNLAVDGGWTAW